MPLFGALFKGLRGVKRTHDLPILIEKMTTEANNSLLDEEDPIIRYRLRSGLLDAMFVKTLQKRLPTIKEKQKYILSLKKELHMASDELSKHTANKAEVAALAIGLKEMSINLDQHVEDFRRLGNKKLKEEAKKVHQKSKTQIEELGASIQSQQDLINGQLYLNQQKISRNQIFVFVSIFVNIICLFMCYSIYQNNLTQKDQIDALTQENSAMRLNIDKLQQTSTKETTKDSSPEQ